MKKYKSLISNFVFLSLIVFFSSCSPKMALQGKIIISEAKLKHMVNQPILLKNSWRVIKRSKIDQFGYFEFKNVRNRKNYSIEFDTLSRMLEGTTFYIAKINGEKIREVNLSKRFEFKLIHPDDIAALSSLDDDDLNEMISAFKNDSSSHVLVVKKYINYDVDSFRVSKEHKRYINDIVKVLKKNKNFTLNVSSHADANGDDERNLALSVKRAHEIKEYVVSKGIQADRIFTYGFGETKPLNECVNDIACSELQHRLNRRTEFVFKAAKKTPPKKSLFGRKRK